MKVTIIGWYGTETIGDRAILGGILGQLSEITDVTKVNLGSLNPFFSERTVLEDAGLWSRLYDQEFDVSIFDSRHCPSLESYINDSDLLIMGGGPLMHVPPLFMVDYAFKYAKRVGTKSIVYACGIGPIKGRKYIKALERILRNADLCLLRDEISYRQLSEMNLLQLNTKVGIDPSVKILVDWMDKTPAPAKREQIAINFRRFPEEYSKKIGSNEFESILKNFTSTLLSKLPEDMVIKMVPMHYFFEGDDDRYFLNELKMKLEDNPKVHVQNIPLSLEETFKEFSRSRFCYGTRFHSVVFQTILNGNNFVFNYTDSKVGKTRGFLRTLAIEDQYQSRLVELTEGQAPGAEFYDLDQSKISFDRHIINKYINSMKDSIEAVL